MSIIDNSNLLIKRRRKTRARVIEQLKATSQQYPYEDEQTRRDSTQNTKTKPKEETHNETQRRRERKRLAMKHEDEEKGRDTF